MGGYIQCDENGEPIRTITIDDVPDLLSKSFALLQTGWFILQCIARAFVLWWNKPLNVRCPVRVWADEGKDKEQNEREDRRANNARTESSTSPWNTCKRGFADFLREAYRPIAAQVDEVGFPRPTFLYYPILNGLSYESNKRRVGTFGPEEKSDVRDMLMAAVVGIVFGGIHCVAWAFYFPTIFEQLLWRFSAISVTLVPLFMALIWFFTLNDFRVVAGIIFIPSFTVYVIARLTLLVLPFMALRSLPPRAYRTVEWTRFIPHI